MLNISVLDLILPFKESVAEEKCEHPCYRGLNILAFSFEPFLEENAFITKTLKVWPLGQREKSFQVLDGILNRDVRKCNSL